MYVLYLIASCHFLSLSSHTNPHLTSFVLTGHTVQHLSAFQLQLKPFFVSTVYHLSGLTEEGTHLSSLADAASLLLFNYGAACFLETAKTNKALFKEAGRR